MWKLCVNIKFYKVTAARGNLVRVEDTFGQYSGDKPVNAALPVTQQACRYLRAFTKVRLCEKTFQLRTMRKKKSNKNPSLSVKRKSMRNRMRAVCAARWPKYR